MGMGWFVILLIWLVAPFAELAVIIVLAVVNSRYKRKIEELNRVLGKMDETAQLKGNAVLKDTLVSRSDWKAPEKNGCITKEAGPAAAKTGITAYPHLPRKHTAAVRIPKNGAGFYQGTAALIIGVIFVVLAGLIFATTAWHVLPSFSKVVMVLGFSGLFFGASRAAERFFKIERTGQAFYILGSVFLFLTVLAAGYFELLGPEFILKGENRFRVLLAGSVATEIALFSKIRRFHNKVYTQACLWGITISMLFLMGALKCKGTDCVNGMMYYSFLLLGGSEIYRRKQRFQDSAGTPAGGFASELMGELGFFAMLHFWMVSGIMAYEAIAGWIEFMTGIMVPGIQEITIWNTLAFGMMAAGTAIAALRRMSPEMKTLHSLAVMIFFQYAGFCIPVDYTYQLFLAAVMTGVWFLGERRLGSPLGNLPGGCIFTAVLAIDTAILMLDAMFIWDNIGKQLTASAGVILLAAVMAEWGRQYPVLRAGIPAVLFALTATGWPVLNRILGMDIGYDAIVWGYVLAVAAWDWVKKDRFCIPVLAIGTAAQVILRLGNREPLPFFLLLAVYLLVKSLGREHAEQERFIKGSCLYSMAGVYIIAESMTANGVLRMVLVAAVYGLEHAALMRCGRSKLREVFWNVTGLAVFLLMMAAFYSDASLALWNMVLCGAAFAGFYVLLYKGGCSWLHLAASAAVLPLPLTAAARYGLTENQVYGATAALLILSGILFRRYRPVIVCREGEKRGWDVDWFHILVILVLLPMTWEAGREWQCVYILLTALYVLQFAALKEWRRMALTLAAALAVTAFWLQPFIRWPEILSLEIQLVPAAGFAWGLGRIWGNGKEITNIRTGLYCLCLGIMALDAVSTGAVWDALILEAVSLAVFLGAHMRKCMRWIRISGIIIISVALYMTKDFWLSLSWWVYLLAAGLGLIVFAAVNEMKKR